MNQAHHNESSRGPDDGAANFRAILKATSLIGGASVMNLIVGMVRTKFVAVLLGPAGVGLVGMYGQITGLVSNLSGMGIDSSGVRQVAEAAGTNDQERIARTVLTLRRTAWMTGALGMLSMVALALPLSRFTFRDGSHAVAIAILGVTILLGQIASAQSSFLTGTRRIADVARVTVLGSLASTAVSVPCYLVLGVRGVVIALVLSSIAGLAISYRYARKIPLRRVRLTWRDSSSEARPLLALGISFVGGGLLGSGAGYLIQTILVRRFGVAGLGIYGAAFGLSGALVGFVLHAMGTDYYPRITAVAHDDQSVRRMVNDQTQVALLLALPGLAAILVFSPIIIPLFYAAAFQPAVSLLRWCVLGLLGRILSWTIGFVQLAKRRGRVFLMTEAVAQALHVALVFLFTHAWGLDGAGMAFAAMYACYTAIMLLTMRLLVGATWSAPTLRLGVLATTTIVTLMVNSAFNPNTPLRWTLGATAVAASAMLSARLLSRRAGWTLTVIADRLRQPKAGT